VAYFFWATLYTVQGGALNSGRSLMMLFQRG